jgi:hypothetical protein
LKKRVELKGRVELSGSRVLSSECKGRVQLKGELSSVEGSVKEELS